MRLQNRYTRTFLVAVLTLGLQAALALDAHAYDFDRKLRKGSRGRDVKALEIRVAGWYSRGNKTRLVVDRKFGRKTVRAVKRFRDHYGLRVRGSAGRAVFRILDRLGDRNGSTRHFAWSEFTQNYNSSCSAQANSYAGSLRGGMVSPARVKRYVRRLMWRLEALRAKGGGSPVGINSGFRSVSYNNCIGGAGASQHMYGTAADNRVASVANRRARRIAKRSQVHGIGCYSNTTHNHFDLRIENRNLPSSRFWWWPQRDSYNRDLDETGRPCWGETRRSSSTRSTPRTIAAVRDRVPGAGALIPSAAEVRAFEQAGEVDYEGAD